MIAYRPEIDGLRAIAIVPVVFFHAGFTLFQGGFVGVDVFFVISGYLITSIILRDLEQGQFTFRQFFERRARRILPALFLVMAVCIPVAYWLLLPPAFKDFAETAAAVALFLSNILFIDRLDYFAPAAEFNPLLHTWSLAVEEQFYLIFPPIVLLAWRLGGKRAAFWTSLVLLLCSFALSEAAWRIKPAQSFFFFPTRAWELLAGALCAFALSSTAIRTRLHALPRMLREAVGIAGFGAILAAIFLYDKSVLFPSYATLLPVCGVVALILFCDAGTVLGRVLGWRGLVAVGLVSYSAYLWHQPLFAFTRIYLGAEPALHVMLLLCALVFVLAALSWFLVERPFRHHGQGRARFLPQRKVLFAAVLSCMAGFVAFGVWGLQTEGRAALWLAQASDEDRRTFEVLQDADLIARYSDPTECRFVYRAPELDTALAARLASCRDQYGPGVAVLGDSHALDLVEGLFAVSDTPFLFGLSRAGCRPGTPEDSCNLGPFRALVAQDPGLFRHVILESAGQHMVADAAGRSAERLFRTFGPEMPIPFMELVVKTELIGAIGRYLESLSVHVPVIWLTPRIEMHLPDSYVMVKGCRHDFALRPGQSELFDRMTQEIARRAQAMARVSVVDQMAVIDLQMPDDFLNCQRSLWTDEDHLSAAGREAFAARLAPVLLAE
ncbi:acyltransferase family protein [Roseinatronobacter sp.]|uniref:acyltransferase family protein n=1 Tax=Roseinatronobacter sp. TaxID=1945755 RepID=UPI0025DA1697|nr:acyltransferase family protein [Roseibaca sp.]